jgi:hypothetical protein
MQGCPRHEPGRWRRAIAMLDAGQGWNTEDRDFDQPNTLEPCFLSKIQLAHSYMLGVDHYGC